MITVVFQSWFCLLVGIQLFFFRRARLICGGQVVGDIDDFNRLSLMLTDLLPEDNQHDIACEGFGNYDFVKGEVAQAADQRKAYRQTDYDLSGNVFLARRVMFKPMLGLFNQGNLIPLRYCPIQIELGLVNSQADAVFPKSPKVFKMAQIGILAIFNASAICLNLIRRSPANMLRIFCLEKPSRSISIPGIIQTNRLDLIRILALIPLVLQLVLRVSLLQSISLMELHTNKPAIFFITLVHSMVR